MPGQSRFRWGPALRLVVVVVLVAAGCQVGEHRGEYSDYNEPSGTQLSSWDVRSGEVRFSVDGPVEVGQSRIPQREGATVYAVHIRVVNKSEKAFWYRWQDVSFGPPGGGYYQFHGGGDGFNDPYEVDARGEAGDEYVLGGAFDFPEYTPGEYCVYYMDAESTCETLGEAVP